jgi:heme A synthase
LGVGCHATYLDATGFEIMISLLIGLIIFAVVVWLLWTVLNMVPLAPPVRMIVTVIFILIVLVAMLNYLPDLGLPHGRYLG